MVDSNLPHDRWLEMLAAEVGAARTVLEAAPSRLKAKIYSALLRRQQESGPLLSLSETRSANRGLCVYEKLVQILPVGEKAKRFNCCSICHARLLAENLENAPIHWSNCPYVGFQNR